MSISCAIEEVFGRMTVKQNYIPSWKAGQAVASSLWNVCVCVCVCTGDSILWKSVL